MASGLPDLTPDIYEHLRNLARLIHRERGQGHQTIQRTVLLHEAWAKVSRSDQSFESQAHFMAVAAKAMRQILLDYARDSRREKRGGGRANFTTLSGVGDGEPEVFELVALDEALTELEDFDPDAAQVVSLRTFGGLTSQEVADVVGQSLSTVNRHWRFAKTFLAKRLSEQEPPT